MSSSYQYFDRDLSWLAFNYRVLLEAKDHNVPLIERLRFLAIYSSNLDEFFRVRVASLRNIVRIDKKKINKELDIDPKEVTERIGEIMIHQLPEYGGVMDEVLKEMEGHGIMIYPDHLVLPEHEKPILYHFKTKVLSFLQPYFSDRPRGNAFLNNRELYLTFKLKSKTEGPITFAYLNIPSDHLPRFLQLPKVNGVHYFIFLDDVIRRHLDFVFPHHEVLECKSVKLNKDADLHIEDEFSGDLVEKIQKQITKRNLGAASRFLYDKTMSSELLQWLVDTLELEKEDLVPGGREHNLNDFFQVPNPEGPDLEYPRFPPLRNQQLDACDAIFDAITERDQMLHFPYHTYDYVLQFFNEAAIDPDVQEIKVTFYRMASNSFIGDALISAARNGKEVMVFMELKARFDEENNLRWAQKMSQAGVKIIYSIPGLKVHAKVAMVVKNAGGKKKRYAFFGTGNLNEKTARIYADHGLFTCDKLMTKELDAVFDFLYKRKEPKPFEHILVSQFNLMDRFCALIDREIGFARQGQAARIVLKVNNLEEKVMIDKLYEASQAGVKIDMIVRGICCLIPGVAGMSENIRIIRIVDRFLEHARVWIFNNGGEDEVYMGSADWMKRNLYRRIEVVFPVKEEYLKAEIRQIIDFQLNDNTKATLLDADHHHHYVARKPGDEPHRAQFDTYYWLNSREEKLSTAP